MKGPGVRIDQDVRRIWRCSRCGRIARTAGNVTSQRCRCFEDGVWMTLEPPAKRPPFQPPHREPIDDPDALPREPAAGPPLPVPQSSPPPAAVVVVETVVVETTVVAVTVEPAAADQSVKPPEAEGFGAGVDAAP